MDEARAAGNVSDKYRLARLDIRQVVGTSFRVHIKMWTCLMRYETHGADSRAQLEGVQKKYATLWSLGIHISDGDYRSLVINFIPDDISSFILAQDSAGANVRTLANRLPSSMSIAGSDGCTRVDWALHAKALMWLSAEEWDCQEEVLVNISTELDILQDYGWADKEGKLEDRLLAYCTSKDSTSI
jgi:hypothetical protein